MADKKQTNEILLNKNIQARLLNLLKQKKSIEQRIKEDVNLIVQSNNLDKEGAIYGLEPDASKIIIKYLEEDEK